MLLILDNCEHVIDQAAKLAALLVQAAPELRVLVTSREPLMLAGEVVWAVPPLDLPGAVRLFMLRAAAAVPGFRPDDLDDDNAEVVAALCRRLDGLPLALELAATRVRTLGVHELLARLDDRFRLLATGHRDAPARQQQTLWAVIDWSWELLTEPERLVLRRLAVAADGCSLPAAETICAEDDLDVLGLVSRLVDRSLVVLADGPDGPRYRLLESVAAYGLRRLHEAGESGLLRERHRRYYAGLAERAAARLRGPDQRSWLSRLDAETANLRQALDSALEDDDPVVFPMVNALAWYWFLRGRITEARRALDGALALGHGSAAARATAGAWRSGIAALAGERGGNAAPPLDGIDDPATRAVLEWFHAFVASDFGDPSVAEAMVGRALASFRALADRWGTAAALSTRAKLAIIRGDPAAAHRDAEQSLALFRELGDRWGQLQAIEWLGAALAATGDREQAARLHRDGLRMAEDLGLWPQAADALSWLGRSALHAGDLAQAREFLERAMRLAAGQSYQPGRVFAELGLGLTARREGQLDLAETYLRSVLRTSRRPGSEPDVARTIALSELGFVAEQLGDPAAARSSHLESLAAARQLVDPQAVAQALTGLAGAHALDARPDLAARLLGAADAARRGAGASPVPGAGESADTDRITAAARRALGGAAFAAEFSTGRLLTPEQASSPG